MIVNEDTMVLPCGCVLTREIDDGEKVLKMAPCHMDCVNLHDLIQEASAASKPIEYRRGT